MRYSQVEAIKTLASQGESLDFRDPHDNTLLHVAAQHGETEIAKILIANGVEVDVTNRSSQSPLFTSVQYNQVEIADLLIKSKADVDGNSQQNQVPLIAAAKRNNVRLLELLLANKASVDERDSFGNTALHHSAKLGLSLIAEKLLEYDADLTAQNSEEETAVEVAANLLGRKKNQALENRDWGTEQVIGLPDASFGDHVLSWASASQDDQDEWLVVEFKDPVEADRMHIHENLGPKAVVKVTVFDDAGKEHVAWEGEDPAKQPARGGVYIADIKLDTKIKSKKFRIHINSTDVPGWNEIDAVGLIDKKGNKQWVSSADASSCFADQRETPNWRKFERTFELLKSKSEE